MSDAADLAAMRLGPAPISEEQIRKITERLIDGLRHEACGTASYQPNAKCEDHPTKKETMSFSETFIGKPEPVKRKLTEASNRLTGQNKEEFDAVKPALETILDQQVNNGVIRLNTNGHASFADGKKTYGTVTVEVTCLGQIAE